MDKFALIVEVSGLPRFAHMRVESALVEVLEELMSEKDAQGAEWFVRPIELDALTLARGIEAFVESRDERLRDDMDHRYEGIKTDPLY